VRASTCATTERENKAQSRSEILALRRRKGWDEVAVGMKTYRAHAENWQGPNKERRTDCTQEHTPKQQGVGAEPEARAPWRAMRWYRARGWRPAPQPQTTENAGRRPGLTRAGKAPTAGNRGGEANSQQRTPPSRERQAAGGNRGNPNSGHKKGACHRLRMQEKS